MSNALPHSRHCQVAWPAAFFAANMFAFAAAAPMAPYVFNERATDAGDGIVPLLDPYAESPSWVPRSRHV